MSPVFRHGGLRLYLLKLLDEAPRHGYEVIRLLQDRFLGVYAPSPGTIYPRLARLEEEGLVTHDEVDGKKVYRITDKGREEIASRFDDLAELEEQITASVRDIAREVTEDVRDTVRSLREEITLAAGQYRPGGGAGQGEDPPERATRTQETVPQADPREQARRVDPREQARRARDEARHGSPEPAREASAAPPGPRDWADWASAQGWQAWAAWRGRAGQPPRSGSDPWERLSHRGQRPGQQRPRGVPPGLEAALLRDVERLAVDFANQLRRAAWSSGLGEKALGDLRSILEDTLTKIRNEVFGGGAGSGSPAAPDAQDTPEP